MMIEIPRLLKSIDLHSAQNTLQLINHSITTSYTIAKHNCQTHSHTHAHKIILQLNTSH